MIIGSGCDCGSQDKSQDRNGSNGKDVIISDDWGIGTAVVLGLGIPRPKCCSKFCHAKPSLAT